MNLVHVSRRRLLMGLGAGLAFPALARANVEPAINGISDALLTRARRALGAHAGAVARTERLGIVDFSQPSRSPRFHLVDMAGGTVRTIFVAHGRGSDPEHSGWLMRFSNAQGSNASSAGAYAVGEAYVGQHGNSRRLNGLDASNANAMARGIVIHAAAYVSPGIVAMQGKLGRSEGCLAVSEADIGHVLDYLGEGSLIYADRVDL